MVIVHCVNLTEIFKVNQFHSKFQISYCSYLSCLPILLTFLFTNSHLPWGECLTLAKQNKNFTFFYALLHLLWGECLESSKQ